MTDFFIDAHCDTITKLMNEGKRLEENDCHIDLKKLSVFENPVQVFAICLEEKNPQNAYDRTVKYIDFYKSQINHNSNLIGHINCYNDLLTNLKEKKMSSIIAIEGADALEGKIENLDSLYNMGVRLVTLTWNYDNAVAGAVGGKNEYGLTKFGYEVLDYMQTNKMIIDVSHISEKSFWEVDKYIKTPYIASHSNAKKLRGVARNLTDEQIHAIANKGGVIGINLYSSFLSDNKSEYEDIFRHIDYIGDLAGFDCLGFGCDFDGMDSLPNGIEDISDMKKVVEVMEKKYGEIKTESIMYKNFLRILKGIRA